MLMQQVVNWRTTIANYSTAKDFNDAREAIKALKPAIVQTQVVKLFMDAAIEKGIPFDKKTKTFTQPEPVEA
jgi:hypothetical protein